MFKFYFADIKHLKDAEKERVKLKNNLIIKFKQLYSTHLKRIFSCMKRRYFIWLIVPLFLSCLMKEDKGVVYSDLERILDTGVLRAITLSRSTSYFDYRGEDMGFEYELVKGFADYLGVELQVSSAQNVTQMIEELEEGNVDLIAYPVTITPERKEKLLFAYHENITNQVLVQKKGRRGDVEVKDVADLIGKEVAVVENTKYAHRLNNLDRELGGGIIIDTFSISENEETLIEKVSMGEIPFTVADNNVAKVNQTYYNNIDISVPISFSQRTAWAVRKDEKDLILKVDEWFDKCMSDYTYVYLYHKYFEHKKDIGKGCPIYLNSKRISAFDELFKKYAKKIGWDWRLLASVAYQESRFNPKAKSWVGARGLMQLMPSTASRYGADVASLESPEVSVRVAAEYLKRVENIFSYIEDKNERQKFVLASYNAGVGHVRDAIALAEKHGKNPEKWNDVKTFVLMKAKPEFFNDPVVRHGYLRGEEVYNFVEEIMIRYQEYKDVIRVG